MQHWDIADKVAGNISRKTGHPFEDLRQIAMMGIIQASRRYRPEIGDFRAYARSYANGEVLHFLRDKGFLLAVPPSQREIYARGQKMLRLGATLEDMLRRLKISKERWRDIAEACTQKIVAIDCIMAP
jgi:RNA polymerase sigma factor (sigma-70 family)